MEALIVGAIIIGILFYNGTIDKKKFMIDNEKYLQALREDDYTFLVYAKYGEDVDVDQLYMKRCTNAITIFLVVLALTSTSGSTTGSLFNPQFFLNLVLSIVVGVVGFKIPYMQLKSFYKTHLHEIDIMLPYYLKSLEILIQHYTVPVALGKSIDDAPDIFKPGLRELINKINSGDSSIDPYMDFANTYPVRDSMRMMRLLYRLGLGSQEKKQERLMMFSRTVSNLQNKARETKYKERLNHMESQTMVMLVITGIGVMLIILISMMMMFSM
ncbi:MAG: hypothetical protein MSS28_01895 [Tenericutes bacterium]|nr:hypothetical protein [Mycoplasmatota bacterium]